MKLCISGLRGHTEYIFIGIQRDGDVEVVGVSAGVEGDDPKRLIDACTQAGQSPKVFDDPRRMLDECRPDVLAIAGPFEDNAPLSAEAMRRGIHVFCEKPVAITHDQLDDLRRAHGESPVKFASMMNGRYSPAFYTAHRLVADGAIGEVRIMNARKSYRLGTRPAFYRSRETFGGTILWVGSHAIDWIYWFAGRAFHSVSALHSTRANSDHGELEATASCQFEMDAEVIASAGIDYLRPKTARSHGDDRIRVAGSDGVIEVRGGKVHLINSDADGEQTPECRCDRQIFADLLAEIRGDGECLVRPDDVFAVARACLLARDAADQRRIVTFD